MYFTDTDVVDTNIIETNNFVESIIMKKGDVQLFY